MWLCKWIYRESVFYSILVLAGPGLHCCAGPTLVVVSGSLAVAALVGCLGSRRLDVRAAAPTAEPRLRACGIFPDWVDAGSVAGRVFTTNLLGKPLSPSF